jgi:hypothetical protein
MLKKSFLIALAAPLLFACGGNDPKKDAPKKATASTEEPDEIETVEEPEAPEITGKTYKALYKSDDMESQAFYNLPVVGDDFPKLKAALTDQKLLGAPIKEVMSDFKASGSGTTSADFKVTYATPELVSLIFTTEFMGAYPSGMDEYKTLDTQTGKAYTLDREVNAAGIRWMLENYKKVVGARIAANEKDFDEEEEEGGFSFQEIRENLEGLSADDLEGHFVFTGKGIRVTSDDVMPHVALALEPDRVVDFSYEALKKYAAPTSVILKKK